jgi:hypothetical protein
MLDEEIATFQRQGDATVAIPSTALWISGGFWVMNSVEERRIGGLI